MAVTVNEKIKVKALSKFGFQLETGEYINFSKTLAEAEKGKIVPGGEYDVEMYRADSGKGYVNKVLGRTMTAPKPVVKAAAPATVNTSKGTAPVAKVSDSNMSKDEWAAKDRRISRQGCIQVAVQVTGTFEEAVKLADQMLGYVNG